MSKDTERFATVPLFDGLDQREIMKLLKIAETLDANPGDELVRQGEPGDGMYIIAAGAFEVVRGGTEKTVLARLEELSFFGEMSLVSEESRSASVVCVEKGRLRRIPREKFTALLDQGDLTAYKVVRNMSRILAQRLSRMDERLVN